MVLLIETVPLELGWNWGYGPVMDYLFKVYESSDPTSNTNTRANKQNTLLPLDSQEAVWAGSGLVCCSLCHALH